MRVKMLWYGGCSYAAPTNEDAEDCDSIAQAVRICEARGDNDDGSTPCVEYNEDDATAAWLFVGEIGDYPDYTVERGPRGAYRAVRA